MIFYIPASTKYVDFETHDGITLWNTYNKDGTGANIQWQNGESDLEIHEILSVGRILEVHKQVVAGTREYDPYAIFSETMREDHENS